MNDITIRFLEVYGHLSERGQVSSPSDFAKKINISTSLMTEILKGRSNAGINPVQNTVKVFEEINADWLLTGKGNKLKNVSGMTKITAGSEQKENAESRLITENASLKETNDLLRFKIGVLEKELSEVKYTQRDPIIYESVAKAESELIKKKTKQNDDAKK
ncbi:hypothetical protein CLU81_3592 [Flavobacterium sp. 9]|uniref:hypothetical protein n=1 Tax=Flavobacterium sp. 9 TaxID=2035198 RepID=UPI000C19BF7F|nr:hypothetical protein [Flavobacterium sp. 9]PIF33022.1 hypothetical protein CLU81_3592 [Flavobacterium sp. 9]